MMKTYRFLLAAGVMLALAFTFSACSDDKDDPITYRAGGCFYDKDLPWQGMTICSKTSEVDLTPELCDQMNGGTFVDDCPPNPKLECPKKNDIIYMYGTPEGLKCSDMENHD